MKLRTIRDDQGKGLARWGWIKKYLGPALKFAGITSEDFDKIILDRDQIIRADTASLASGMPTPDIAINDTIYTPTGAPEEGEIPTSSGYWCISFTWTAGVETFDTDPSPDVRRFSGTVTIVTPPSFVFSNAANTVHTVGLTTGTANSGATIIPLAHLSTEGVLTRFIEDQTIYFYTQGGNSVNAWIQ